MMPLQKKKFSTSLNTDLVDFFVYNRVYQEVIKSNHIAEMSSGERKARWK